MRGAIVVGVEAVDICAGSDVAVGLVVDDAIVVGAVVAEDTALVGADETAGSEVDAAVALTVEVGESAAFFVRVDESLDPPQAAAIRVRLVRVAMARENRLDCIGQTYPF